MTDDEELAERLRAAIGRFVRSALEQVDQLPPPQISALGYLGREGALSIAELAKARGVRHQSMSRTVGELQAAGLVERRPDPRDARAGLVALTPAGRTALTGVREARRDWIARAVAASLTPEERAMLAAVPALLDRLAEFQE